MNGSNASYTPRDVSREFGDDYGSRIFSGNVIRRRLSPQVMDKLERTTRFGTKLDPEIADEVAAAMKDWAIENGCTHYCHWFQPLTGTTAEKHDSFLNFDGHDGVIAEFTGESLIRGEPDASSFPTGNIRDTFEARGYTAWDPTSPAFITINGGEATLCIPTVFVSWTGESLDQKTPLLRSIEALNTHAMRILRAFGSDEGVNRVTSTLGCEQEYFLVDEEAWADRPDLMLCGRTLLGADSPKGHQLDDHYFGSIPHRVLAFMGDSEERLYRLGIPAKTRHNEVAPGQFELAPLFETTNLACDHQMLTMSVLKKVAREHGMVCLIHEKPFAGVNGSGKHNNWSLSTDLGRNLLSPKSESHSNLQFLAFVTAVVRAIDLHADMLRATVANAANDLRLGANEAPPAIISIFAGHLLQFMIDELVEGKTIKKAEGSVMELGSESLPKLERHAGDRNRTSPFAFIGNRFEFRAVGSQASVAWPNTVLNTIIAESLDHIATKMETVVDEGMNESDRDAAMMSVLQGTMKDHQKVVFNGDNYSDEWKSEADRRGLPNLRTTPDALPALETNKAKALFDAYSVLSESELDARVEVLYESYVSVCEIEARTQLMMLNTMVMPAVVRYQSELAESVAAAAVAGVESPALKSRLEEIVALTGTLHSACGDIDSFLNESCSCVKDRSVAIRDTLLPAMERGRSASDSLEGLVPADLWPLPSYTELLFAGLS
ncbi:MAG: glutamine synthetase type III [Phycisphaerae bacterium]|nr:glutamine synthetase type III [Phycisphaerae bacterium]